MNKNVGAEGFYKAQSWLLFLLSFNCIALVVGVFQTSYKNINLLEKFIFRTNDGWCYGSEGVIGSHCFGDFGVIVNILSGNSDQIWTSPIANYPPLLLVIFKIVFVTLANLLNYKVVIGLFLLLETILILYPIRIMRSNLIESQKRRELNFLLSIYVVTSLPFLITLDRGNLVGLSVPLLFLYLSEYQVMTTFKSNLIFLVLASLKPQFAILLVLELRKKQYMQLLYKLSMLLASNLIAILLLSRNNIFTNLNNILKSYSNYASIDSSFYPYNYSFSQAVNVLSTMFGVKLNSEILNLAPLALTLVVIAILVSHREKEADFFVKISLIILSFMSIKLSFAYYSIVVVAILYLAIEKFSTQNCSETARKHNVPGKFFTFIALIMVPIYIPANFLRTEFSELNMLQLFHPIIWSFFLLNILLNLKGSARGSSRNNF